MLCLLLFLPPLSSFVSFVDKAGTGHTLPAAMDAPCPLTETHALSFALLTLPPSYSTSSPHSTHSLLLSAKGGAPAKAGTAPGAGAATRTVLAPPRRLPRLCFLAPALGPWGPLSPLR